MEPQLTQQELFGQSSFTFSNETVEVNVTERGGMTAPVRFTLDDGRSFSPYYINPWHDERHDIDTPVLSALRGDFFCLPFGGQNSVDGEEHPAHGESASSRWTPGALTQSGELTTFSLSLDYSACSGTITKELILREGECALYSEHTLHRFDGAYPLGHHATLSGNQGELTISVKPFDTGLTSSGLPWYHSGGEYQSLRADTPFDSLSQVQTVWRDEPVTDCSRFPAREGFVDIMAVYRRVSAAAAPEDRLSWTAAVNQAEGWVWFSLKDASLLPATVFWMENHGRHQPPWSGRNCCIGLEEVCAYFADGRAASIAPNPVAAAGIPTAITLSPTTPTRVRYIQGLAPLPDGFDTVRELIPRRSGIALVGGSRQRVEIPVAWEFLFAGKEAFD